MFYVNWLAGQKHCLEGGATQGVVPRESGEARQTRGLPRLKWRNSTRRARCRCPTVALPDEVIPSSGRLEHR